MFAHSRYSALPLALRRGLAPALMALAWEGGSAAAMAAELSGRMVSDPVAPVTVTASRDGSVSADRRRFDVRATPDAATASGFDLIARLPGAVIGSDGKISLLGRRNLRFQVDGRNFPEDIALEIPAIEIRAVEIISNPGAQSGDADSVIINFITTRSGEPQLQRVAVKSDTLGGAQLDLDYTRKAGVLTYTAMIALKNETSRTRLDGETAYQSGPVFADGKHEVSKQSGFSANILNALSRRYPDDVEWVFLSDFYLSTLDFTNDWRALQAGRDRDPSILSDRMANRMSGLSSYHVIGLDQRHSEHDHRKIELAVSFSRSPGAVDDQMAEAGAGPARLQALTLDRDFRAVVDGDLEKPLGEADLKLGFDAQSWTARMKFRSGGQGFQVFTGARQSLVLWGSYEFPIFGFKALPGLRVEYEEDRLGLDPGLALRPRRREGAVLPSLHLQRTFGDRGRLSLSWTRKRTAPDLSQLDDRVRIVSLTEVSTGDSRLRSARTDAFEAGLEKEFDRSTLSLALWCKRSRNPVSTLSSALDVERYSLRPINLFLKEDDGLDLNFKRDLNRRTSLTLDLVGRRALARGSGFSRHGLAADAKFNLTYSLSRSETLLVGLQYQGADYGAFQEVTGGLTSTFKYQKTFGAGVSISLEGLNLIASDRRTIDTVSPDYTSRLVKRERLQALRLGLVKNF